MGNISIDVDATVYVLYAGNKEEHYPKMYNMKLICDFFLAVDWV